MRPAALVLETLAAMLWLTGCASVRPSLAIPVLAADTLLPSPRLVIGRVIAVDPAHAFAILELTGDAPADAISDGAELATRTASLQSTARLRASRYLRGRTLGSKVVEGQPAPGDEVVWLAP